MAKKFFRILITVLALIFIIVFSMPLKWGVLNIGNIVGGLICLVLIIRFGFSKQYKSAKEKFCKKKAVKIIWRIFSVASITFAIYACIVSCLMIGFSLDAPKEPATAIVLGAKVNNYGPSVPLLKRIQAGENYLNNNPNTVAVVTGGKGTDEYISEGDCMYNCMVQDGIEADRIFVENKAQNTYQNIEFSYNLIKENKLDDSLAIVTDSYHQLRARLIARKQGITTDIGAVNTSLVGATRFETICTVFNYPTYFVREWFAIPVEFLK